MPVVFSSEELTARDRSPVPVDDLGLVSLGQEFLLDDLDLSDLECHPRLASDLPLNSELQSLGSTANL